MVLVYVLKYLVLKYVLPKYLLRGAKPLLFGVSTFAPSSASSLTTSTWPFAAATKAGVAPASSGVSTSAPSSASSLTTST